ncbi:MAG: DUF3488 and transglutaminase-like domain-containing protein [Mariprofundaceae bacterium]|nr:DUF3488 and transglutaminase-like domain-containing protein [Mariprofundaceae bacterium]
MSFFPSKTSPSSHAEKLTLGVLMSGVIALALSDFVSPLYWSLPAMAALLRWWRGSSFALTEMQASFIGWFGFIWVGLELLLGRPWVVAFTDFLLILALAVTIETATPRNHLHRMLTGLFLMLAGAVLTDSVLYAIPLIALMWFTWRSAICLYGLQQVGGDLPIHSPRFDVGAMIVMIIMALGLFIGLPRFDIQTKLQPTQPRMETTGFSDHVQLGDFARELDATVILRAEVIDIDADDFRRQILGRYWRGVALSQYINHGWRQATYQKIRTWMPSQAIALSRATSSSQTSSSQTNSSQTNAAQTNSLQTKHRYEIAVFREASDHAYILLPDGVSLIQHHANSAQLDSLGQLRFSKAPARRLRLTMVLDSISNTPVFYPALQAPLAIESDQTNIPNAIRIWVKHIVSSEKSDQTAEQQLQMLTDELHGWVYDLNAPIDAQQPLTSFINNKRGHCELYASTLALAARTLGIPSRIVNGYYGGEWNDTGAFLMLRQQHAHSWVEVWLNHQWQRIDPTPASRWQLSGVHFPTWDAAWETLKLTWYRYVLAFQDSDREALLQNLFAWLKKAIPWLLMGLILFFITPYVYRKTTFFSWPWWSHNIQQKVLDRWLEKRGVYRPLSRPLRLLPIPYGVPSQAWINLVKAWENQAYSDPKRWTRRQLKTHLRALSDARW